MVCDVYLDWGLYFVGKRTWWMTTRETPGFHHFRVLICPDNRSLEKCIIAVPLARIKYLTWLKEAR